jgi:hypothetical protein
MVKMEKNTLEFNIYPYEYVYKGIKTILLWQTSAKDGEDRFVTDSNNRLISSKSLPEFRDLLGRDLKKKVHWSEKNLRVGRASTVRTCTILLEGWNFIEDVLKSVGLYKELQEIHSIILDNVYNKLFYGNNLSSVTPEGKSYNPVWTKEEITLFRHEIRKMWKVLRKLECIKP